MKFKFLFLLICLITTLQKLQADSPVTSTPFSDLYIQSGNEDVIYASKVKSLDKQVIESLLNPAIPVDVKAAICNALGWSNDGNENAKTFFKALKEKYNTKSLSLDMLSADDCLVLGYLSLLGDYFNPQNADPILQQAVALNPKSYTCNMILALCKAQEVMDTNYCDVWKAFDAVKKNTTLNDDMPAAAIKIIFDYMVLYKETCN